MSLSEELAWRGFVNQTTLANPAELDTEMRSIYLGVDPSSDSMTVGNLAVLMMVRHFKDAGHKVYMLVGGATGMIGDPSGKDEERNLQTLEAIANNKQALAKQYTQILGEGEFTLVDNYDWFKDINFLEFLRDVGKHFSVTQLLDRDFIANRIGRDGSGISYAEFSYTLIQGYDFLHLFREHKVSLQICGADQWGNCISGVDLIRKTTGQTAHVWSAPLVINKATGKKFGKSEAGAVWLDSKKTSVYEFYQFWLNCDDQGVIDYLKIYTLLPQEEILRLADKTQQDPAQREAQRVLAYEVTRIVHGDTAADSVRRITQVLFGHDSYNSLRPEDFTELAQQLPLVNVQAGQNLVEPLVMAGLATSNTEARRFIETGAVYLNGQVATNESVITPEELIQNHAILRRGKNAMAILQLV